MAIEYLLVTFPEQRNVFADGAGVGVTNHILMLPGDEYEITLDGGRTVPASQDVALVGTSMVKPLVVVFNAVAPPAPGAGDTAPAPVTTEALAPTVAPPGPSRPTPGTGVQPNATMSPKSVSAGAPAAAKPGKKVNPDA